MGDYTTLDLGHFGEASGGEAGDCLGTDGQVAEVQLVLLVELGLVQGLGFGLGLLEFVVVQVVSGFGRLGGDALYQVVYISEALFLLVWFLFYHVEFIILAHFPELPIIDREGFKLLIRYEK